MDESEQTLRKDLTKKAGEDNLKVYIPAPVLCTDNAAMIAATGYHQAKNKKFAALDLNAIANIDLSSPKGDIKFQR